MYTIQKSSLTVINSKFITTNKRLHYPVVTEDRHRCQAEWVQTLPLLLIRPWTILLISMSFFHL